jgi:LCP family protein required for cell wall assembly
MKKHVLWVALLVLLLVSIACGFQEEPEPAPFTFTIPPTLTPPISTTKPSPMALQIQTTNSPLSTSSPTLGFYPTPTAKKWPLPYFGSPGPTEITPIPHPAPVFHDPNSMTLLLLGSDKRTGSYRTDTMVVVIFHPDYHVVTLLSIPRDLFVYIPGWKMQRINAAFQYGEREHYPGGGPGLVKDTLLYNLGIEVDYYAMVNFEGFKNIINILGGVDVPVVCPYTDWRPISPDLDYNDEANLYLYTVNPGVVHMDGDLALWYVRARKKSSDFDRNRRQQEVLRSIYSQALRLDMIGKIPELYEEISQSLSTDFTLVDALSLAPQIFDLPSSQVRSYYISSSILTPWTTPQNAAVQIPKGQELYNLLREALSPPDEVEQSQVGLVVEVWNGTSAYGWEVLAAERLHYAGYDTLINPADRHDYSQTLIFDYTENQDPGQASNLLRLFELNEYRLIKFPDPTYPYDYKVILGADYDPCFQPKDIQR